METHNPPPRLFPIFVREGRSPTKYNSGFIDASGKVVIPPIYDRAHPFRNSRAAVLLGEKWGAIDEAGDLVIPPRFSGPLVFTEGLAKFTLPGDRRGVVDLAGEVVVPARYRFVSYFSNGIACVRSGELFGFIDRFGREIIPPFFEDARAFSEGLAAVRLGGKWGYIRPDGSSAISYQFICEKGMAGPFRQGLARVAKDGKWGYINPDAEFVVAPRFDMAHEFSEGLADVELGKRCGFVNLSGELVIDTIYSRAEEFSEGVAQATAGTNHVSDSNEVPCDVGFIDKEGNFAISPRFFRAGRFQLGRCLVETREEIGYIDHSGTFTWKGSLVDLGSFDPHHLLPSEAVQKEESQ
jgi:hypothetical protein